MKVPGQESANAHTGPPWTSRISGNGPSPCGSVRKAWISRPSGAVHESTVREATLDRRTSVPSLLVETTSWGRAGDDDQLGRPGRGVERDDDVPPTGAAARKNRPPARSSPIAPSRSPPRRRPPGRPSPTADARGDEGTIARQERNAHRRPTSGRRTVPSAGSIRTRSPATTRRSLQTASTTATTSLVGEPIPIPAAHPTRRASGRSRRTIDHHDPCSVPGALARFLGRDRDDAVLLAPVRLQMLRSARHRPELIGGHLHDHQSPTVRSTPSKESTSGIHGGRSSTGRSRPNPPHRTARPRDRPPRP